MRSDNPLMAAELVALLHEQRYTSRQIAEKTGKRLCDIQKRITRLRERDPSIPAPMPLRRRPKPEPMKREAPPPPPPPVERRCLTCGKSFESRAPRAVERVCYDCKRLPGWQNYTMPDCRVHR